jgi:hypothetical protein
VKALAATSIAVIAAKLGRDDVHAKQTHKHHRRSKKHKRKKRGTNSQPLPPVEVCRGDDQTCGPGIGACCNASGLVRCQEFPTDQCQVLSGFSCCGIEGAPCNPNFGPPLIPTPGSFGNCSCCSPLFCGKQADESFRCQDQPT